MSCPAVPLRGPLVEARFVARPNRFLVRALLPGGEEVWAHLPNSGRLRDLLIPGCRIWLRPAPALRKTPFTAVLVEPPEGGLASLDTTLPNRVAGAALAAGVLEELSGWRLAGAEVTVGGSRFDFHLRAVRGRREMFLEVKSVTLVEGGVALFPDAVTARGARHVRELAELARRRGKAAAVLFVVQRADAHSVRAAHAIDPDFARALAEARDAGVRILGRRCEVGMEEVRLGEALRVEYDV